MSLKPITMPILSDTMSTGKVVSWTKQPGDAVRKGEVIAEVESDKAVMEVEAFEDGYLAGPLVEPGREVAVGETIGYLSDRPQQQTEKASPARTRASAAGGAAAHAESKSPEETPPPAASAAEALAEKMPALSPVTHARHGQRERVKASPYARQLAHALGVDLGRVTPTDDGVIQAAQVVAAALRPPFPDLEAGPPYRLEPLSAMQEAVADNMSATVHTPVFRVSSRLSMDPLLAQAHEQKLSATLLLARACAQTVTEHPRFNAAYTPEGLAQRERVDVGIAVDLAGGLVTPVLRDMAGRPLAELAEDWRILKEKVFRRRLAREDYTGATFYLSNLGMFPAVDRFDALLPLGAAAILAVGAAREGKAELTLSCDHRVVYGADAARFLESLSERLADPQQLLW